LFYVQLLSFSDLVRYKCWQQPFCISAYSYFIVSLGKRG